MSAHKMALTVPFLVFVLIIQGSQSMDTITPEQILERIAALEQKGSELTDFNTKLLTIVDNHRVQLKQKDTTINQLLKQVEVLEEKEIDNQNLRSEVSHLQARIAALETKTNSQTDKQQNQERNEQSIDSKVDHSHNLESHRERIWNAILSNNKSLSQIAPKDLNLGDSKHLKHDKATRNIREATSAPELVAFHAINDHGETPHIGVNQNIIFEKVWLNLASGYHVQHGVFIAPTNGLYLFSTSIMANSNGKAVYADLVKDGVVLARVQAGQGHGGYDQGSVTVVTQLNAADEVWVRLYCCADDTLYGGRYTSFTGVMLTAL